jgi:hypothetical protein
MGEIATPEDILPSVGWGGGQVGAALVGLNTLESTLRRKPQGTC